MPRIAVCLITARQSYSCLTEPRKHIFAITADSLAAQTFGDFEFIVADVLHADRGRYFEENPYRFPARVVPPRANPWHPRKRSAVSATRNAVFDVSDAHLYLWLGDGWSVGPDYLERVWKWYSEHGAFADGLIRGAATPDSAEDAREPLVTGTPGYAFNVDAYGGCMDRAAYERTGGYDEIMDACWGLEDCEMSARLRACGYRLVIERGLHVYTRPMAPFAVFRQPLYTLCPVALCQLKYERIARGDMRAGQPVTEAERSTFLPQCRHLTAANGCRRYPGEPTCSQPDAIRRPDPNDPDVRIALHLP